MNITRFISMIKFIKVLIISISIVSIGSSTSILKAQAQSNGGLFVDAQIQGDGDADDPTIIRSRYVGVNFELLGDPDNPADTVVLNLFGDTTFTAIYDRTEFNSLGSYAWIGHIEGVELGQVTMVVTHGLLAGTVSMPGATYQVRPIGGNLHAIQEIDQSAFPPELEPILVDLSEGTQESDPVVMGDDTCDQITVLVAYSPEARAAAGGTAAMESLIALAVTETNQSYVNSGLIQRLSLVYTLETSPGDASNNFSTDLSALQNLSDGVFDNVDAARETYYADEVALIIESSSACGLGYLNSTEATAFSVTARACATGYYSFGHELGHNMGARHDWYIDDTINYSKGFVNVADRWRTIMAYDDYCDDTPPGTGCTRLQYWSNPDVSYGVPPDPMGVISTGPTNCVAGSATPDPSSCAADNRTTLNNSCTTVANFRVDPTVEMDVEGNSISIPDGDTTPSMADHTDFGSASISGGKMVRIFTIQNEAAADLNLTGSPVVSISGTHAGDFGVTTQPLFSIIPSGSEATFQVTFDPSATGVRTAEISIDNNDNDENPYNFSIQGTGTDTADLTVLSVSREDANPTGAGSVDFTVVFSASVTGVDTTDFNLTTSGISGASVSSVSGSGDTYTVSVGTGTGNGLVRLDVLDDDSIIDGGSNPLSAPFYGGEAYLIDKTAPTVLSSVRVGGNPTAAPSVDFTVTFSESVTGVDTTDFSLTTTGSVSGAFVSSVSGSDDTYTVTVDTGSGDGTIRLDVTAFGTGIQDSAANPLSGGFTGGQVYTIQHILYVAAGGLTSGFCDSWANACELTQALSIAVSNQEVWVKAGTYKPTSGTSRSATFQLKNNVGLYGGFAGTETLRNQRDWATNLTALSGDLNGDDSGFTNNGENSYHVVTGSGTNNTAIIDGFTISGGNTGSGGGGMYNIAGSPTVKNCIFSFNNTTYYGGGMYNEGGSPVVENCTFSNNVGGGGSGMANRLNSNPAVTDTTFSDNQTTLSIGGGMYNYDSSPTVDSCTFSGNQAYDDGGGMANLSSGGTTSPVITNSTFSGNTAGSRGGGMYNSVSGVDVTVMNSTIVNNTSDTAYGDGIANRNGATLTIRNSIVADNTNEDLRNYATLSSTYNIIETASGSPGYSPGTGDITGNQPNLNIGSLADNGGNTLTHELLTGSVAIDAGTTAGAPSTDQRGIARPQGPAIDMGAFEVEVTSLTDTTVAHFNSGTLGGCLVDAGVGDGALKLNLPSNSCAFESRIHDAGVLVDWTTLTSTETLPAGTSVSFEARTGNTTSPDVSWTNWQNVSGSLTNPGSQYIQYRATLSTTDTGQTPVLEDVTINYTTGDISVLNTPDGTLTTWDGSFDWTGVNGATWYLLDIYSPTMTQLHRKWYTSTETGCPTGTACSFTPTDLSLGNGDYLWRVMDYGAYGYGIWPYFKSFTLNAACYTLATNVSPGGSGTIDVPTQTCAGGYTAGSVLELIAVPGTGYAFSSWSGDVGGSTNPVSVTMDGNKSVTANMHGNTPLTPSGTLTSWDKTFSWTGLIDATWYLIEVQTSGGSQVFRKWYTSADTGCSSGTACSVTATGLSLDNGDYKWRVLDYGAYGYGINSAFKDFTLNAACHTMTTVVSPAGSGTVDVPAQSCTGGYIAGSVIELTAVPSTGYAFTSWSGDAGGSTNPISVTMDGHKSVTANMRGNTPLTPTGTLTSWDKTFSWTGLSDATWYLLEVQTSGGSQVFRQWYTSTQTGCPGGTACSVTPASLNLGNGDYKWRVMDYGAYGYGLNSAFKNFTLNVTVACTNIRYVDVDSTVGTPDGCSWGTAYQNLQDALADTGTFDQIWVAEGTYYPDMGGGNTLGDRNANFALQNGLAIYGGFNGTEAELSARDEDPATNGTVLSGDIGNGGMVFDNTYQVVLGDVVSSSAVLDGFTITAGNSNGSSGLGGGMHLIDSSPTLVNLLITNNSAIANGGGVFIITADNTLPEASYSRPSFTDVTFSGNTAARGGGFYTQNASPSLTRVTFTGNTATSGAGGGMNNQTLTATDAPSVPVLTDVTFSGNIANGGGGMFNINSNPVITNATFSGNTAHRRGGGMLNENGGNPSLTNVTFYGNISDETVGGAPWGGGGMMNVSSSPSLNNVTFSGNDSETVGGDAIYNAAGSNPTITNSILWGDLDDEIVDDGSTTTISNSVVQGGFAGTNIITTDPNLQPLTDNGGFTQTMALGAGSSAVDVGNNGTCATSDQRGVARPQGLVCDAGAYELDVVLLISPSGTQGSWDNTFSWTGLSNATWYLLEVYTADGSTQEHRQWYTSTQTGCSGGTSCSIVPPETAGLGSGDYKWIMLDYGPYGYGNWTDYMEFTIP